MSDGYSYGHGVLRSPDPRFMALQKFCETRPALLEDPVIQLVKKVSVLRVAYMVIVTEYMRCRRTMSRLAY